MNNSQTIGATLFAAPHPDIVKRISVFSLICSVVLVAGGLGVFFSAFQLHDMTSSLSMLLMVTGTVALLWGIFRLFWKSKQLFYAPTGSITKENALYFDVKDKDKIVSLLEEETFPIAEHIKSVASGNLRLDVLCSQDSKFVAAQLYQFVPYTYDAVTKVHYFTGDKASALLTYLFQDEV